MSGLITRYVLPVVAVATAVSSAMPNAAFAEDEAHRLDRLATKRLNEQAAASLSPATTSPVGLRGTGTAMEPRSALRDQEEQAIARWQVAVARCRALSKPDDC